MRCDAVHWTMTVLVAAVLVLSGCGRRTAESETANFNNSVEAAKKTMALYPEFRGVLGEELGAAESAMAAAKQVADDKEQVAAMGKARKMLSQGTFGKLSQVESALRELKTETLELTGDTGFDDVGKAALIDEANQTHAQVQEVLKAGAADATAAAAVLEKALSDITIVRKGIAPLLAAKRKAAKAVADAAKQASSEAGRVGSGTPGTTTQQAVTPAPPAQIKCKYCGRMNPATATKCAGCGAALTPPAGARTPPPTPNATSGSRTPPPMPAAQEIKCKYCGKKRAATVSKCPGCGAR